MAQLQKISGVVRNLQVSKSYEDFVFTPTDKNVAGAAALGAAAMGQLFNSAALASASGGAEIDVECFTCTVNDTVLAGRFHKVEFKEGDFIEFAIQPDSQGGIVHAARNPQQRKLWMLPYQMRGHIAQKKSDWKWSLIFSALIALIGAGFFHWGLPHSADDSFTDFFIFFCVVFCMVFVVIFWAFSRLYTHSIQATEVIRALGYKTPEHVDLPALSKIAEKRIRQQTGKPLGLLSPWSFWY